jgi:hypothetical protein
MENGGWMIAKTRVQGLQWSWEDIEDRGLRMEDEELRRQKERP